MPDAPAPPPAFLAIIEEALAPYAPAVPPELLAMMRERMLRVFATQPYPVLLARVFEPPPQVVKTGEVARGAPGASASATPPAAAGGRSGGR